MERERERERERNNENKVQGQNLFGHNKFLIIIVRVLFFYVTLFLDGYESATSAVT